MYFVSSLCFCDFFVNVSTFSLLSLPFSLLMQVMEFPECFNQLELLETHGHVIPVGTESAWDEEEDSEDDEGQQSEEWLQQQELKREDDPVELMLWAAEKNRVNQLHLSNHLSRA